MTPERIDKLRRALARRQPDLTVLTDSVNKSHNISAIVRTADAVGIHRIHAISETGLMRRHHMIAGGAKRWVGVTLHPSTASAIATLRADGWRLIAAHSSARARDYRDVDYTQKIAVIVGAELIGVSQLAIDEADEHVQIPMQGLGESLNVSVATAVILLEAARQRQTAGFYDGCRLAADEYERTLFEWAYPEIAQRCRDLDRAYPALNAEGEMASNPLAPPPDRAKA